jgi:hypothetical protein
VIGIIFIINTFASVIVIAIWIASVIDIDIIEQAWLHLQAILFIIKEALLWLFQLQSKRYWYYYYYIYSDYYSYCKRDSSYLILSYSVPSLVGIGIRW